MTSGGCSPAPRRRTPRLSLEDDSLAEFSGGANGTQPPVDATLVGPLNPQGAFSDQGDNSAHQRLP